jgi:hypothetical protein
MIDIAREFVSRIRPAPSKALVPLPPPPVRAGAAPLPRDAAAEAKARQHSELYAQLMEEFNVIAGNVSLCADGAPPPPSCIIGAAAGGGVTFTQGVVLTAPSASFFGGLSSLAYVEGSGSESGSLLSVTDRGYGLRLPERPSAVSVATAEALTDGASCRGWQPTAAPKRLRALAFSAAQLLTEAARCPYHAL